MGRWNRLGVSAVCCWLAHVLVISFLHAGPTKDLLTDALQALIGVLTVAACFQASARSHPFGRTFWRLAGVGFAVLTIGLLLATYAESFNPSLGRHSWIIDVFVNAWTAPLVMCLFLDEESQSDQIDWRRILDFAQVAIVFLVLSLYSSNLALSGAGTEPWGLALATDFLICVGFFLRGMAMPSGAARLLFVRFGYFRMVSVVTDLFFVLGMPEPATGEAFDLVWSLTTLLPLIIAVTWKDSGVVLSTRRSAPYWRTLVTQLLPLIFPLLVMIMAARIVRAQLVLAAFAVLISLIITYARLLLTQREQERSAAALRESHGLLQSIMEGANEIVFVKDLKGRYLMINTPGARMLGLTVDQVIGKTDAEIFPPDAGQTVQTINEADAEVIRSRKPRTYDLVMHPRGGTRIFLSTKSPYFSPQGELIGLICFSVDVTDQRKLEQQMRQTQKMEAIGTLSGGIAHDFNNLLTVIKGYTGLLMERLDAESLRSLVGNIDQAAERAAALTRQLLAYSRRQVLQPKVINLNSLVHGMDRLLRRLIGEDVEMSTVTDPNLGSVRADPGQIEQVIMNLAVNSRDAMPTGGRLTLETSNIELGEAYSHDHPGTLPGRYVMLAVSDTGTGMDAETKAHIFEPFFTTKQIGRGTGLGLSTVYGIIKQSGGTIEVYSEPAEGTTFKVYLPRVEQPAESLGVKVAATTPVRGHETILLVEDDVQVRELAAAVLSNSGYNVLVAESSREVAGKVEQHEGPIDLLLTDVVMPGIGGRELANQVKARRPGIKVLYMSGYTTNAIVHHGVLDPGTFFLQKPFTPSTLTTKIREVLDHRQQE